MDHAALAAWVGMVHYISTPPRPAAQGIGRERPLDLAKRDVYSSICVSPNRLPEWKSISATRTVKKGGRDKHCLVEARLEGMQPVAATDQVEHMEQAVHGAADKLEKLLDHELGRLSDQHGRNRMNIIVIGCRPQLASGGWRFRPSV